MEEITKDDVYFVESKPDGENTRAWLVEVKGRYFAIPGVKRSERIKDLLPRIAELFSENQ
jgi:hypothetical protein